jgi:hypothetical protein
MSFFSLIQRFPFYMQRQGRTDHLRRSSSLAGSFCALALVGVVLAACSSGGSSGTSGSSGSSAASPTAVPQVSLTQLKWCSTPSEVFRDQASANPEGGASATTNSQLGPANGKPKAISDWNTFKANMGFTLYLPSTLPANSCLLSVSGSLRDPVFGSNFTITYVLPSHDAISFSQAPARSQTLPFQCNVSQSATPAAAVTATATATDGATSTETATVTPTPAPASVQGTQDPVQLCNGLRNKTNVVFSARGQTAALQQFFQNLQADVDWTPAQ